LIGTRGGFSSFFSQFKDPGPAMFFYAQNMIVITSTLIFLGGIKNVVIVIHHRISSANLLIGLTSPR
jgi:hypothetical protein